MKKHFLAVVERGSVGRGLGCFEYDIGEKEPDINS